MFKQDKLHRTMLFFCRFFVPVLILLINSTITCSFPVFADDDLASVRKNLSLEGRAFQAWLEGIKTVDIMIPGQAEAFREAIRERFKNAGIRVVAKGSVSDVKIGLFLNPNNENSLLVYDEVLLKRNPRIKTHAIPTYALRVPSHWASTEVSCSLILDQFLYDYKVANKLIESEP